VEILRFFAAIVRETTAGGIILVIEHQDSKVRKAS
jgi:hypothetical protein